MPRDTNGTYILPAGNPVADGTPILNTWAVTLLTDISVALTASLAVAGSVTPPKLSDDQAGFQAALEIDVPLALFMSRLTMLETANTARIGVIRPFPLATPPAHFLECAGQLFSIPLYPALFAKIGNVFGGDGITTFRLPDLRGEQLRGWDHGRGIDAGRVFGSAQGATVHLHGHTASSASAGTHAHGGTTDAGGIHTHTASAANAATHTHTFSGTSGSESAFHTHSLSDTTSAGGSHNHTRSQSTISRQGFSDGPALGPLTSGAGETTSSAGSHSHTFSGSTGSNSVNHVHQISGTTTSNGDHGHTVTVVAAGSHTHALTTSTAPDHTHAVTIDSGGTGENGVRNVAMMMCIKFE